MGNLRDLFVAAITCLSVGGDRCWKMTPFLEKRTEIERSRRIPALIGAAVSLHRAGDIAVLFEEQAEMASGCGMATLIGTMVGCLGLSDLPPLLKQYSQTERACGIAPLVRAPVGVLGRRHLSPFARRHGQVALRDDCYQAAPGCHPPPNMAPFWLPCIRTPSRRHELQMIRRVNGSSKIILTLHLVEDCVAFRAVWPGA